MDGTGFPLLDLPDLPILKVFNFMTPLELWSVSNEKPYCHKLAKKIKFNITFTLAEPNFIWFRCVPHTGGYSFRLSTKSEEEWRSAVSSVSKFLERPFDTLIVKTEDIEVSWAWILSDHRDVQTLSLKVKKEEDLQKVLKTISNNEMLTKIVDLYIDLEVPENSNFSGPLIFDNNMFSITFLRTAPWLTIQNIIECNAKSFSVRLSTLRDEDFNSLLKTWLNEDTRDDHFQLSRYVKIEKSDRQNIDLDVLLDGLRDQIRSHQQSMEQGDTYGFLRNNTHIVNVNVNKYIITITSDPRR